MEPNAQAAPTPTPAAAKPPAEAALPNVPATWPGAFGIYKYSKQAVRLNLGTIVLIWVIEILVAGVLGAILKQPGRLISYLVDALFLAAGTIVLIASVRRQQLSVGDALNRATKFWLRTIGLGILVGLSIALSFLLLIIPFFFVFPRLVMSYYYLVDKDMGVVDAYKASWDNSKGHAGQVWGIVGATILMALLSITIIGIPFSIYFLFMYSAAIAVLYESINKQPAAKAPAPAAPAATPPAPAQ